MLKAILVSAFVLILVVSYTILVCNGFTGIPLVLSMILIAAIDSLLFVVNKDIILS